MRVDAAKHEVICKVVYYGPGMSGKTTNLKQIHDRAPARSVGDVVTLDTHSERTLRFDLLPLDLGPVNGRPVRFDFYTVPGQSYYASTRKLVLDGADAVVFVADSRREALDENIDSMNDLLDNLRHLGLGDDLPVVIQYNKQDLPSALKPEQLEPLLNSRHWPAHTAIASTGVGVLETMKTVTAAAIRKIAATTGSPAAPAPAARLPQTWLISCYRCQNMLEITGAKAGDLFTCGACRTTLEITDLDRGQTRAPPVAPQPAATRIQQPQPAGKESSGYGLLPLNTSASGSLSLGGPSQVGADALGNGAFELEGFEQLALLDENVQARRLRVRNRVDGSRYRALVINAVLMRQPGYATQIEAHIRLAGQVRHQHILPLHALHQGRETPIILSQDPPDHESLAHVLARRRVLAPPHAVAVAKQIALACEEASRHGVVHGWLRPDALLLNAESQVLIDEFAVLKHHRYLMRELSGASAATEYYLAPEHLSDDARSDARSDMFQLGALLFRMLTGEGLITGYTAHEALHKVAATGCRPVRSVLPQASRDLDAFVSRLTAIERKDRPQTWSEVIDLCDRFGGGARRQTFRVTQPIEQPARSGGGTRSHTGRPATSGITGTVRRTLPSGGTAQLRREPHGGLRPLPPRKSDGSNGVLILLLVLVVLGAAAVALYALSRSSRHNDGFPPRPSVAQPTTAASTTPPPPPPPKATRSVAPTPTPPDTDRGPAAKRLPGFMGGGPAITPGPTTAPALQPGDAGSSDLLLQIADAERDQRYREALDLCQRLPEDMRRMRSADISASHLAQRAEVTRLVRATSSLEQARALLETALTKWNMPGDAEWAQATMQLAGQGSEQTQVTKPESPSDTRLITEAAWAVEQALAKHHISLAKQAAAGLAAGTPAAAAMQRRIELWNDRVRILGNALTTRKPLVRILNPSDGLLWDVTHVEDAGLTVTSPTGSSARWEWAQVSAKSFSQVALAVAESATPPDPDEAALAVIALSVAGDTVLATVQFKKARTVFPADLAADLETSLALHRQYDHLDLIGRSEEAARAGNAKLLGELLEQLRKPDRIKDPEVAASLARLDEALLRIQAGGAAEDAPLRDTLTFDSADDLHSLPLRDGEWMVEGGQLRSSQTRASVGRKDLANAKSLTVIFQNQGARGAVTVNFRGVRVLMDLAKGTVTASTRDQELAPATFDFIPRTAHTLYIELRGKDDVLVELNTGVVSLDLTLNKASDQLALGFDTGAAVSFEEISITRETRLDPVADAQRIAAIRNLGFEPIGQATLVAPAIVLPNSTPRSGLGFARREGLASLTFEAKGKGRLEVRFGKLGEGGGQIVTLDLGKDPEQTVRYTVSWTDGMVQVRKGDPSDEVIIEDRLQGDPPQVMIIAQQEATLVSTPRFNRQ